MKGTSKFLIFFVLVFFFSTSAFASTISWINTGVSSDNWNDTSNWSGAVLPGSADTALFNTSLGEFGTSTSPIFINANSNIGAITFDTGAGNYTIGSTTASPDNPLLLTSTGSIQIFSTLTSTNAIETINAPVTIEGASGTASFVNNSANGVGAKAGTLNFGGVISGAVAGNTVLTLDGSNTNANTISGVIENGLATTLGITKTGAGTWVLSGVNTYTGPTTVSLGTLKAGVATQAFGVNSAVTMASGSTLDLNGYNQSIGSLTGVGEITSSAPGAITLTVGSDNSSPASFSGNIENGFATVGLNKVGTGTLILAGPNAYTGATTVTDGTLKAGIATVAFGYSAMTVDSGATLDLGGYNESVNSLNGANGAVVTNNGTNAAVLTVGSSSITSSSTFSGLLTDGTAHTLGLATTGNGNLVLANANTYTGATSLGAGSTISLDAAETPGTSGPLGNGGLINLNGGYLQYTSLNQYDYSSRFGTTNNQDYNVDTNNVLTPVTWGSALTSTGGELTKIGLGTLILTSNNNTYSGTTTISGGTLQIGSGPATGSLGQGNVTINANGALAFDSSNDLTVSNIIQGGGTLEQNGTSTVTLSGANTYSGAIQINAGTLQAGEVSNAFGVGSAVTVGTGAYLDLNGNNESIGSLAGTGYVTNNGSSGAVLLEGSANTLPTSTTTFSGVLEDGSTHSLGLTNTGSGTLVLSGLNTYSGVTTLTSGKINLDSIDTPGTSGPLGSSTAVGSIVLNGGYLQYSSVNSQDYSGRFTENSSDDQQYNVDTNGQNVTWSTALTSTGGGELTKIGLGTLTLNATSPSTYDGGTTVNGGTLTVSGANATLGASTGTLSVNNLNPSAGSPVTLNLSTVLDTTTGSLSGTITNPANAAIINNGGSGRNFTVNQTSQATFAGVMAGAGSFTLGAGSSSSDPLTLSGANTYSGGTTISAGVLAVANATALGTGNVTVGNGAMLNLGTTSLLLNNTNPQNQTYTQSSGSTLALTAQTASVYGSITTAVAASVVSGSAISVHVSGWIQNGSMLDIINTGGMGINNYTTPLNVSTDNGLVSFTSSVDGNNLVLNVVNSGLAPLANSANAKSIATTIDHMTNPSSDMTTVLNQLAVQSNAKITSALNSMVPAIDGGAAQNSTASLNNLVSATLDRIQSNLDHAPLGNTPLTGISSGDENEANDVWAKPFGSYLEQTTLDGIQGYNAWNTGTVVGYDHMLTDDFTLGVSAAYAYGEVNSVANNATTGINSAEGNIYAGYQDPNLNYYIDGEESLGLNWYDGQRNIVVGNISRNAQASYFGQEFSTYVESGYKFNPSGYLKFTPLASLQWTHLNLGKYTETNAGALDLAVNSQSYDTLETGLGASIAYTIVNAWGNFIPEFHTKWLHDFINDNMSMTSTFTGGGASFTTNGATPSRDGADIGGKLTFDFYNNFSLIAAADAQLKNGFFGIFGSGTVRYKF